MRTSYLAESGENFLVSSPSPQCRVCDLWKGLWGGCGPEHTGSTSIPCQDVVVTAGEKYPGDAPKPSELCPQQGWQVHALLGPGWSKGSERAAEPWRSGALTEGAPPVHSPWLSSLQAFLDPELPEL